MLYAAIGLVCLALLVLGVVVAVAFLAWLLKPKVKAVVSAIPAPSEILAPYRRHEEPRAPPPPDLDEQFFTYGERRKREKDKAKAQANLDALVGIADVVAKAPGVAAPKDE